MRNVVVFGDAMADRSPCGTGTSAKLATLHHWGEIKVGEEFVYESLWEASSKDASKKQQKLAISMLYPNDHRKRISDRCRYIPDRSGRQVKIWFLNWLICDIIIWRATEGGS